MDSLKLQCMIDKDASFTFEEGEVNGSALLAIIIKAQRGDLVTYVTAWRSHVAIIRDWVIDYIHGRPCEDLKIVCATGDDSLFAIGDGLDMLYEPCVMLFACSNEGEDFGITIPRSYVVLLGAWLDRSLKESEGPSRLIWSPRHHSNEDLDIPAKDIELTWGIRLIDEIGKEKP